MSTVSNPYTFNIKSNCGFSTNPLISNNIHQVKITMKYSEKTLEADNSPGSFYINYALYYSTSSGVGNMIPTNIFNGDTITGIRCDYNDGFYIDPPIVYITMKSSKKYSKIQLNGGPIKNCLLTYYYQDNSGDKWYMSPLNTYDLKKYDNVPFDLTIEFVE